MGILQSIRPAIAAASLFALGVAASSVSVAPARAETVFGPREEHAKHKHTTCDEIVFCVPGRGVEGIETSPGKFEELEYAPGTTLRLPRGVGHCTRNPDYFENLHLVGIFVGVPNMDKDRLRVARPDHRGREEG